MEKFWRYVANAVGLAALLLLIWWLITTVQWSVWTHFDATDRPVRLFLAGAERLLVFWQRHQGIDSCPDLQGRTIGHESTDKVLPVGAVWCHPPKQRRTTVTGKDRLTQYTHRLAGLLFLSSLLGGCTILPPADRITTADAKHTYITAGHGSPTVVLESGLGDGKDSWVPVFSRIAERTKVFAYDRAGYGSSKSAATTRDGATLVRELRSTLQALQLQPPYILVGHSIGGTYMELYARTYPDEVAGVVLVDSRHADFTRQCVVADAGSCTPPALLSALLPEGPKREMASGDRTFHQVLGAGPFPDVPLIVLTGGKQLLTSSKFYDLWLETQGQLASLSSQSTHTVCRHCGHYVHKDNPKLVIDAVASVLEQVRRRSGSNRVQSATRVGNPAVDRL